MRRPVPGSLLILVPLLVGVLGVVGLLGASAVTVPAGVAAAQGSEESALQGARLSRAQGGDVTLQWLGWNAWRITTVDGRVILLNPFINNPDSPIRLDGIPRADLILVTNGHGDEVGQAVEIANSTGGRVVSGSWGLGGWFIDVGVPAGQVTRLSPGERISTQGITVRALNNVHGSDIGRPTEAVPSGGIAGSFMVTLENGWTLYYGASGAATQDMALWAGLYQPDAAILYMNATKEPLDFALSAKLLRTDNPNLQTILPGHHRYQQAPGTTTIDDVQRAVDALGVPLVVTEPVPGQELVFGK